MVRPNFKYRTATAVVAITHGVYEGITLLAVTYLLINLFEIVQDEEDVFLEVFPFYKSIPGGKWILTMLALLTTLVGLSSAFCLFKSALISTPPQQGKKLAFYWAICWVFLSVVSIVDFAVSFSLLIVISYGISSLVGLYIAYAYIKELDKAAEYEQEKFMKAKARAKVKSQASPIVSNEVMDFSVNME